MLIFGIQTPSETVFGALRIMIVFPDFPEIPMIQLRFGGLRQWHLRGPRGTVGPAAAAAERLAALGGSCAVRITGSVAGRGEVRRIGLGGNSGDVWRDFMGFQFFFAVF